MSRKPAVPGIDRRQQMLVAALEIFAEQGFEAATNKAIADRAGVNQGLIYFYFTSKADVYFATFAYHAELVIAQLDAVFAQEADTRPEDGFARLLKGIVLVLSTPPAIHLLRIMYQNTASRTPPGELSNQEGQQAITGLAKHLALRLREYLESQMSRGEFSTLNPGMASYLITRTLIATVGGRGHNDRAHPDFDLLAETMARLYCYGLLLREGKAVAE